MLILDAFDLVKPELGLVFWTLVVFVTLWTILGKVAFKPIANALKDREKTIEDSLAQAEKARAEMAQLTAKNEQLLNEAKEERNRILAEARVAAEKLKNDMVEKAHNDALKKITDAMREIETQKQAAIVEIKNHVGQMALSVAEKVVRQQLSGDAAQKELVEKLVKEASSN
ncbi:MAG: F0F1 ATP synthase subunit B [Chitinophagales bacterium]